MIVAGIGDDKIRGPIGRACPLCSDGTEDEALSWKRSPFQKAQVLPRGPAT